MRENIIKICNSIIEFSFYLLFFLIPLILTPLNYELFEFNKMVVTYALTIIIAGAWLIKMVAQKEFKIQRTPLDIPVLLFFLSQVLSTIFSIDRHTSLFGYYSRFHGGLLSTISYLLLYYALVTNLNKKTRIFNLLYVSLFSGFLVVGYGILEHFGIDAKYWIQDVKNRVFSTLGQPNWLAAYLNILLFITLGLILGSHNQTVIPNLFRDPSQPKEIPKLVQHDKKVVLLKLIPYYILLAAYYLCLLYTKSRSGFSAFIFCLFIFTLLVVILNLIQNLYRFQIKSGMTKSFPVIPLATCYLLLITTTFFVQPPFFNLDKIGYSAVKTWINQKLSPPSPTLLSQKPAETKPSGVSPEKSTGPALETGGTESSVIRKIVWQGALDILLHYPLFGSGVETFAYSYYQFRPASHNLVSEWDFLYNKAHNEFLNYAATTGFVGLITYLILIFGFIAWVSRIFANYPRNTLKLIKSGIRENSQKIRVDSREKTLQTETPLILILAFLAAYISILITNFFGFSVVIVALYFWLIPAFCFVLTDSLNLEKTICFRFYKTQKGTEKDRKAPQSRLTATAGQAQKLTISTLSNVQKFFIFSILFFIFYFLFFIYRYWLADTKYALAFNYDKTNAFTTSYPLIKQAISLNPYEPVYYDELSFASANIAALAFNQKQNQLASQLINESLAASQKAVKNSPKNVNFWKTRTKVFYVLSSISEKYNYEALQALLTAKELAPTDAKIYYNLAILYARVNQKEKAIETLKETIKLKDNYQDAYYALGVFLADNNQKQEAVKVFEDYLLKFATDEPKIREKIREWSR